MATSLQNLSIYDEQSVPSASKMKFGIVVSEWNRPITDALYQGAKNTLLKHGATEENIVTIGVPGSFELTAGARLLAKKTDVDAIICLGCVIQGDTPHFDYVCQGVTQGITQLNVKFKIPFIFGVLTTDNQEQAEERAGGKHGNKGDEAAITAIKMVDLSCRLKK
ncbi:6,7-dimethyl-8-ribityllumazine synthase [Natronoflexus pectinivorans]|uniref:6,7-dimethyl-8-ribityllumazine synthase n=1 Tax=Natronoflexus pectinivorans TaxID=682526 RepID=A0A4R2GNL2_9BACT|nr:6,7-dimethyl-8-ribityllumazine synthase [Natronoflexus pectinivorans]TCO09285.1 6,7-dimethyl-8-ribityllumazine synthase [Natronoflexus pectinivorans]